jgi:hypothetical protein
VLGCKARREPPSVGMGLSEGCRCAGFLTFGVVSEQFKTRRETYIAERDTQEVDDAKEVTLGEALHLSAPSNGTPDCSGGTD